MDLLDMLTLEQLSGEQRDLAETIGLEAYKKLVKLYSGTEIRIPVEGSLTKEIRNALICEESKRLSVSVLARKWNMSNRNIRMILKKNKEEQKNGIY